MQALPRDAPSRLRRRGCADSVWRSAPRRSSDAEALASRSSNASSMPSGRARAQQARAQRLAARQPRPVLLRRDEVARLRRGQRRAGARHLRARRRGGRGTPRARARAHRAVRASAKKRSGLAMPAKATTSASAEPGGIRRRAYARGQHRPGKARAACARARRQRRTPSSSARARRWRRRARAGSRSAPAGDRPGSPRRCRGPRLAVDDGDRQVLGQRRVLQAVVHDDGADLAPARLDGARARGAIAGHERRARRGQAAAARRRSGRGATRPSSTQTGPRVASAVAARKKTGGHAALQAAVARWRSRAASCRCRRP